MPIANGSFESGNDTGWSLYNDVDIHWSNEAQDGEWVAWMAIGLYTDRAPAIETAFFTVTPDVAISLSFWAQILVSDLDRALNVFFDDGVNGFQLVGSISSSAFYAEHGDSVWSQLQYSLMPLATNVRVRLELELWNNPLNGSVRWELDNFIADQIVPDLGGGMLAVVRGQPRQLESVGTAKHTAIAAFRNVLSRIIPAKGFYYDLSDRVYKTMVFPESSPFSEKMGERWAYICLPLVEDNPSFEVRERKGFAIREWTMHVFGFVNELQSDRLNTDSVESLTKLEDDILRAVLQNPSLDKSVTLCEPIPGGGSHAGWPVDTSKKYGELELLFRVRQQISVNQLGPQGA